MKIQNFSLLFQVGKSLNYFSSLTKKIFCLLCMTVTQNLSTDVSKAAGNYRAFCMEKKKSIPSHY